ncbi:MAG: MBL fold metallo-hydrolase [Eubacteriales bacterium]|nr:MBL fold metallo-hydrolase [Eubacteriales bacterium]
MRLISLYSGSSGNCILLDYGGGAFLVDAGNSGVRIREALNSLGMDMDRIRAILVTHEHSDHIQAVGILARKYSLPVYMSEQTYMGMQGKMRKVKDRSIHFVDKGCAFEIDGIEVTPFALSHDAADPVGYRFCDGKTAAAVATDTGIVTLQAQSVLKGCRDIILESNHDLDMLMRGSYPAALKQRILSDKGHLSNDDAASFCASLIENGTEHICLGHLSKENNTPMIAFNTVNGTLEQKGMKRGKDYTIQVASRDFVSDPVGEIIN